MAQTWIDKIRDIYEGDSDVASRFRYGLLYFDIGTILYVVATSFASNDRTIPVVDALIGLFILIDFCARFAISKRKVRFLVNPISLADLLSIGSFLIAIAGGSAGFLRVLRTLRLLHTYQLLERLRSDVPFFREKEELLIASINLAVFLFVMTGLIYGTQHQTNPDISNYVDALYFTVSTLTTTGYGDVILEGTFGRLISVGVMIIGVTLFLRLAQVIFRPRKVRQPCRVCGLTHHDVDAVHCKHCGATIKIATEGVF